MASTTLSENIISEVTEAVPANIEGEAIAAPVTTENVNKVEPEPPSSPVKPVKPVKPMKEPPSNSILETGEELFGDMIKDKWERITTVENVESLLRNASYADGKNYWVQCP